MEAAPSSYHWPASFARRLTVSETRRLSSAALSSAAAVDEDDVGHLAIAISACIVHSLGVLSCAVTAPGITAGSAVPLSSSLPTMSYSSAVVESARACWVRIA